MEMSQEVRAWLRQKIAEHEAAGHQAQAQANAQMGAAQAYRILLDQATPDDPPKE